MSHRLATAPLLVASLVALLAGCGGGGEPQATGRGSGAPAPKAGSNEGALAPEKVGAAAPAQPAGAPSAAAVVDESQIPEKLRNVDWDAKDDLDRDVGNTRDPFQVFVDEVPGVTGPGGDKANQPPPCQGPLCEFEVGELQLIAIITGTAVHKAMVVDPKGMGHVIRAGDVVGKIPYRVTRVTRNDLVFKPMQPPVAGQPAPAEVIKRLASAEELEELSP